MAEVVYACMEPAGLSDTWDHIITDKVIRIWQFSQFFFLQTCEMHLRSGLQY